MAKAVELISITPSKAQFRHLCILTALVFVMAACIALYMFMEDNWAEDTFTRQRILILSAGLFLTSIGICYYAARAEPKPECEFQTLIIDNPPSYHSLMTEDSPPPSYNAVIHSILLIPQQETG